MIKGYVIFAIVAYLAFAVNSVIDKFLLKRSVKKPGTYAFYIGLLSGLSLLLFPFGLAMPSLKVLGLALLSGALFVYAMVWLFSALKREDVSRVLPAIGALVPVVTFAASFIIVGERLAAREVWGLLVLVIGTLLISWPEERRLSSRQWLKFAALSAVGFALSFTLAKAVYLEQSFVSGLIWTRLGMVAAALSLLLSSAVRKDILASAKASQGGSRLVFVLGQLLAAAGGILQNYSVSLGSVTIVNALQGTQFAFLFILTWSVSSAYPKILDEDFSRAAVTIKLVSLIFISAGLLLIA
ncbi:MAG: EamA family transporter [Patescibacteria group bacterium]|nr:EamA family transporter [Patescibacteria group bacterium]